MTPFMIGPFRAPLEDIRRSDFMNRGVDMTPFMKGPFSPWNTYDDPIYESGADMTPFIKGPFRAPL